MENKVLRTTDLSRLPEELRNIADPAHPVPESLRDRYMPSPCEALNMAKLLMGIYLVAAVLSVCLALTVKHENELLNLILLAVGVAAETVLLMIGARHKKAGGHMKHWGTFALENGIFCLGKKGALWIPREAITGFVTDAQDGEYKPTWYYPEADTEAGHETLKEAGFATVGLTKELHGLILEDYRATGAFSLDAYQHAARLNEENEEKPEA